MVFNNYNFQLLLIVFETGAKLIYSKLDVAESRLNFWPYYVLGCFRSCVKDFTIFFCNFSKNQTNMELCSLNSPFIFRQKTVYKPIERLVLWKD